MKIVGITLAALLVATAAPAAAQDDAAATGASRTFTGPRVEARVSYDQAQITLTDISTTDGTSVRSDFNGVAFGGEVGFDVSRGALFGVYGGAEISRADRTFTFDDLDIELEGRRNLYAGARLGFTAGDRAALYVKGGYSRGRFRATQTDTDGTEVGTLSRDGYHVGGGVEGAIGSNAYTKLEYVYTSYNRRNNAEDAVRDKFNRDQFVFGLGLRF